MGSIDVHAEQIDEGGDDQTVENEKEASMCRNTLHPH